MSTPQKGTVYLVGAGPGDPGLLTVRAGELLARADVVVYDYLVNIHLLDRCRADCERIYVGKRPGFHAVPQAEIEQILVRKAGEGKSVVRLKGGDPFVFGRGGEEALTLKKDAVPFEIVPGVTAALAAAACAGIPLTQRNYTTSVTFITGHERPDKPETKVDWAAHARAGGTLVLYMGMGHLGEIARGLIDGGLDAKTPAAVIEWASTARQRSVRGRLDGIAARVEEAGLKPPGIVILGEVAALSDELAWFEQRPLFGRRIALTRNAEGNSRLRAPLEERGAEVLELPLIAVRRDLDPAVAQNVWAELAQYGWLVFTSANGVEHFFGAFAEAFNDIRALGPARVAVLGERTAAAVRARGLAVDLEAETPTAESLAEELIRTESLPNERVLVVTGNRNRPELVPALEKAGALVDTFAVYRTDNALVEDAAAAAFREQGADALVFASSSAVESFVEQAVALALEESARRPKGVSFGPQTSATMRKKGLPVDIEAREPSLEAVIEALQEKLGR